MTKKYIDDKGLTWLVTDNENINEGILEAITERRGHYSNRYYPIILNNKPCFAFINTKGYIHFILGHDHWRIKGEKCIHVDSYFKNEYIEVLEQVKQDNVFLNENGKFNDIEEVVL